MRIIAMKLSICIALSFIKWATNHHLR